MTIFIIDKKMLIECMDIVHKEIQEECIEVMKKEKNLVEFDSALEEKIIKSMLLGNDALHRLKNRGIIR